MRGTEDEAEMFRFGYPPATEADLAATEEALGFALPPLLRFLYLSLANGGFGPAAGLTGAIGGHPWPGRTMTIEQTASQSDWRLSADAIGQLEANPDGYVERPHTPSRFLTLCDWGDGSASCLDGWSGHLYTVSAVSKSGVSSGDQQAWGLDSSSNARSLEDWFERWLRGDLRPGDMLNRLFGAV